MRAARRLGTWLFLLALGPFGAGAQDSSAGLAPAPNGFDIRRDGIERGTMETVEYDSKSVGVKRKMVVYLPPGYSKETRYPVLYLLHGIGDNETGWQKKGSADVILDNLHAAKKLVPMIVIMPNGRASATPPPANPFAGNAFQAYAAFEEDLLKDLIPYVEAHYPAIPDREHRALAGLSMGGGQSLNFGLKHPDTFAWIGGFSSAPNTRRAAGLISDPAHARQLRLLWVSCGDQDRLMDISRSFHTALEEMRVPHVWHVDSGGHTWPVWKNDLYLLASMLFRTSTATAQAPPGGPRPGGGPMAVSPEVHSDRRVTFRLWAPRASDVTLRGDWMETPGPVKLEKGEAGVWSATVGPLAPDYYSYAFTVDEVRTLDPGNPTIKQGISSLDSMFFLPGSEAAFEDQKNVPHGDVRKVWYTSSTLDMQRRMHVYTPPGYDGSKARYPVFYLLHGGGDEDSGWSTIGRAGFILDNLLAEKKAKPMIVVMPNGSLPRPANLPRFTPGTPPSPEFAAARAALQARFTNELLRDVVPFVEKNYRVATGRENRAIAGLSMGGGQTLSVVTANPDQFAYVGVWSAGIGRNAAEFEQRNAAFLNDPNKINKLVRLFSISVGDKDFTFAGSKSLSEMLTSRGIKNELNISGGGHTWINWRHYLNEFAPRLFR